jgi:hypothetical protein
MPQDSVSFVIHALLTDQDLRDRFAIASNPILWPQRKSIAVLQRAARMAGTTRQAMQPER